jgi:hypothetical protein
MENENEIISFKYENVKLLQIGKGVNKNGRVYTRESIEKAISAMEPGNNVIQENPSDSSRSVGLVENLRCDDEFLYADCYLIEDFIKENLGTVINVRPIGTGNVNEDGTIDNYTIMGMTIVKDTN